MRNIWVSILLGLSVGVGFAQEPCKESFSGRVLDRETGQPLAFATVRIDEEALPVGKAGIGTITDLNGYFRLENLCLSEFNATFSFLGYKSSTHHHDSYHNDPEIYLSPDHFLLESVVVEGEKEESIHTTIQSGLSRKDLIESGASNFAESVSQLSGVGVISNGQNIVKPVIHGLYGNRILIINNGIRHEYQSWGAEHAPEIDPSQADEIKIVKGAATVHYGPDALGGVLLINPADLILERDFRVDAGMKGHSNGHSYGPDLKFGEGYRNWAYSVQGSFLNQGDLKTPDYNLTNTGKQEYSYSGGLKWHKKSVTVESRYSRFNQDLGILRGSVNGNLEDLVYAMKADVPNETGPFSYKIKQPFQAVDHQLFLLKTDYVLDNQSFTIRAAYQVNHREEYDVRRGTRQLTPNIDLKLATRSVDFNWLHPDCGQLSGESGIQWQTQDNDNLPGTRTALFIPNFNYYRLGAFLIESMDLGEMRLEAGVRYDFHRTSARGIFQGDSYTNTFQYHNLTYSLGLMKPLSNQTTFRLNFGSAWRPPNIAELYAFGRHQSVYEYGFWTFELDDENNVSTASTVLSQRDKTVFAEKGYKLIGSLELLKPGFQIELSAHGNYIQNYIYGKPAGITNTVRGAFPFFIFDQTDALFLGADLQARVNHTSDFTTEVSLNYLWAKDISSNDYFVGLPPVDMSYKLVYESGLWKIDQLRVSFGADYFFKQYQSPRVINAERIMEAGLAGEDLFAGDTRNFDFLPAPDGYVLLNIGVSAEEGAWHFGLQSRNLLNQAYRSYSNRLRYYADESGRDVMITLRYTLKKG